MDDDEKRAAALGWSLAKYRREVKRWADGLVIAAMPASIEPAECSHKPRTALGD